MAILELATLAAISAMKVNKSIEIDAKAVKKNSRAFTKIAEAERMLNECNKEVIDKLNLVAKRKYGILSCHIKMFEEQFKIIKKISFKEGKGIQELQHIDEISEKVCQYVSLPSYAPGKVLSDGQFLVSMALYGGLTGYMIRESKDNLNIASTNVSQANAIESQMKAVSIGLKGLGEYAEITAKLLEKLGMLYMQSIKKITSLLKQNGMDSKNYSDDDLGAINISLEMTKVLFKIINTPMIDDEGNLEQEYKRVIEEGQCLLAQISGGM